MGWKSTINITRDEAIKTAHILTVVSNLRKPLRNRQIHYLNLKIFPIIKFLTKKILLIF